MAWASPNKSVSLRFVLDSEIIVCLGEKKEFYVLTPKVFRYIAILNQLCNCCRGQSDPYSPVVAPAYVGVGTGAPGYR